MKVNQDGTITLTQEELAQMTKGSYLEGFHDCELEVGLDKDESAAECNYKSSKALNQKLCIEGEHNVKSTALA